MAVLELVVLTLVAVVTTTPSYPTNKCTTGIKGSVFGNALELPRLSIPRGELNWVHTLPWFRKCRLPVGIQVTACDRDGPPSPKIMLLHLNQIIVKRYSYPFHNAIVDVTLYCGHQYL